MPGQENLPKRNAPSGKFWRMPLFRICTYSNCSGIPKLRLVLANPTLSLWILRSSASSKLCAKQDGIQFVGLPSS